jgi:ABC-type multidrug transport system fused ATPase/permease subunit
MLRMPVYWFERAENTGGALSSRLESDCRAINSLVTTFMATIIQTASTLICGIVIAFIFEWRTALVAVGLLPLLMLSGVI